MSAKNIAYALGSVKELSTGYLCKCPCHDDKTSSLSIKETKDEIIVNCFAGCDWQDIKEELKRRNLWEFTPTQAPVKTTPQQPQQPQQENATYYIYKDHVGNILARKVKLQNKTQWFEHLEGKQ